MCFSVTRLMIYRAVIKSSHGPSVFRAFKYFQMAFSITWFNVSCRPQGSKHYSRSFTTCTNFAETTLTIIFVRQTAVPSQYVEIRFSKNC